MTELNINDFTNKMMGCMEFGLPEKDARQIIAKGKDFADYFEKTAIAAKYEGYKKSGLPIDIWAIREPDVILEKYVCKAQNKEALLKAIEVTQ